MQWKAWDFATISNSINTNSILILIFEKLKSRLSTSSKCPPNRDLVEDAQKVFQTLLDFLISNSTILFTDKVSKKMRLIAEDVFFQKFIIYLLIFENLICKRLTIYMIFCLILSDEPYLRTNANPFEIRCKQLLQMLRHW